MADDRKDLPPITAPNFLERVREVLSVYLGNRGDVLNRGVTLRDMVDGGMATLDARFAGGGKGIAPLVPTIPTVTVDTTYVLDLTPPPAPTGFSASAALTTIIIRSDGASYTAGHGPAKSRLYGATGVLSQTAELTIASPCIVTLTKPISTSQRIQFSSTGSLPTGVSAGVTYYAKNVNGLSCEISATDGGASINTSGSQSGAHSAFFYPTFDATHLLTPKLTEFSGSIFNYSTNPATTWHLWLTWVTADGVESVTPAGGTNGVVVTTGQDVALLLAALNAQITASQLNATLSSRIDLIDMPTTGLISKVAVLEAAYGGTIDAATSAAEAAASAAAAVAAEAAAIIAQGGAANSATTASTKATEASTSASNAAGSASAASTSATTAATAATTAGNSATAAATSETNASTYATSASTASTASTAAKVAAESAQSAALGSASAASTSASTATTKASEASTSAISANTSANTATTKAGEASTSATNAATSETNAAGSASSATSTLTNINAVVAGAASAAVATEATARVTDDNKLFAQYTVKLDVNGYVSGFGLASTLSGATPYSAFIFKADQFAFGAPGLTSAYPFIIQATAGTVNGVAIPAGVYIDGAYIKDLTAAIARMGDAWIDNADIANLSAAKITAGSLQVGSYLRSTIYTPGSAGWTINADGTCEFGAAYIRDQLVASQIDTRGLSIKDAAGNIILAAGTPLTSSNITPAAAWLNSNVTYAGLTDAKPPTNADNTASNTAAGIAGQGAFATLSQVNSGNASTYIAAAAIGSAQIGSISTANLSVATMSNVVNGNLSSGARTEITNNRISIYNASNAERVRISS